MKNANKGNGNEGLAVVASSEFTIEKGVAVPKAKKSGAWNFLKDMEVGDSFFISGEGYRDKARQAYQSARKTHNISLTQRELTEGDVTGIRLWRVAEKSA